MTFNAYIAQSKKIITLAIPIVIAEAGSQLTHIADTLMVGNVAAIYIAASALASYIYLIPFLFAIGIAMSITPITGNAYGRNGKENMTECKQIFSNAMFMQFINAIVMTSIIIALGNILPLIDSDAEKVGFARTYFNYIAISTFPLILLFGIKQYIDAFGYTIYGMIAIMLGNVLNVFFNWVFIYGNLGMPQMELDGAGFATLISRCLALVMFVIMVITIPKLKALIIIPKIKHINKKYLKEFTKYGLQIGGQQSIEIAAFSMIIIFAGWLGTNAAASYQITVNICGIAFMASLGIATAATIVISNYRGANDIEKMTQISKVIISLTIIFTFVCSLIIITLRFILPPIFVNDVDVINITSTLLLMLGLVQIPDGLNVTIAGILRGVLDTKIPLIINTISFWIFMIPMAYILVWQLHLGIYGLMLAVILSISINAIVIYIRYKITFNKIKN